MDMYDFVVKNRRQIFKLYKAGIITATIIGDLEIYKYYLDSIKVGKTPPQAARSTQARFQINRMRFYRIKKKMQQKV
jgi:hypothetical protein